MTLLLLQISTGLAAGPISWPLVRLSLRSGLTIAAGLAAGVVPGLFLAIRHALAGAAQATRQLDARDAIDQSARRATSQFWTIAGVFASALTLSVLGQSLLAVAADELGAITRVSGAFVLDYRVYAAITIAAYLWQVLLLTVQSLCFAVLHEGLPDNAAVAPRLNWAAPAAIGLGVAGVAAFAVKWMEHTR